MTRPSGAPVAKATARLLSLKRPRVPAPRHYAEAHLKAGSEGPAAPMELAAIHAIEGKMSRVRR